MSKKPSEAVAIVGSIDPRLAVPAAYSTAYVAAKNFHQFLAQIAVGALVATSTVNAKLEQATSAAGAGVKDVPGKAITALTAAGADDNKQALINLRGEELDVDGGFAFVRLTVTVAAANANIAGTLLGCEARNGPASDHDAASVDEIVG